MANDKKITEQKKAYVTLLHQEFKFSYRQIATRCKISKSGVERICKVGMEWKPPKRKSGRPPILTRRDKDRFLRKFKSIREQNLNVTVAAIV